MKKSFLLPVGMIGLMLTVTGCVSHYRDSGVDYLTRPENATKAPYYTEYRISQNKVTGQGKAAVLFWIFHFSDGNFCQLGLDPNLSLFSQLTAFSSTQRAILNAKSAAMYQACEKNAADQILGATFEYRIKDFFFYTSVECTGKGYPATAKGVKMLDRQPVILNSWQRVEYLQPNEIPVVYSDPKHAAAPPAIVGEK